MRFDRQEPLPKSEKNGDGMSIFFSELRKVWCGRIFPLMLAVLSAANLLLLWMGTRPTANQPSAGAYRAVGEELSAMTMQEMGDFLHERLDECEGILKIDNYYRQLAYGGSYLASYREENAPLFDAYEQIYRDKSYPLYTDDLSTDYQLFRELCGEYDTVAAYPEFLQSVQTRAGQLAGISIFHNDATGYDLKNIEQTAEVYAGLGETVIRYYPQKGIYTAISYPFTDGILLAAMLLLALLLVRRERDSGLLQLVRSMPGGRLKTALAKLAAFGFGLFGVILVLYGVNLAYCGAAFGLGPLERTIQSIPALMRCTMQITAAQYLLCFLLAKWAAVFAMGLWVMLAALWARHAAAGWAAALAVPLAMYGVRELIPATARLNVIKYANLVSLMQTNELLGNYRNLYWFGSPVGLPLVEWAAAAGYTAIFGTAFCLVFARCWLLPAKKEKFSLPVCHKTRPTVVFIEEGRKLLVICGAGVFAAAFLLFCISQGMTSRSYLDADEIYYAGYMKEISGPFTQSSADWLTGQGEEFAPMLETQKRIQSGKAPPEALYAYMAQQQKYNVYTRIISGNINGYLKEHPGAWLVYETGYRKLFGLSGTADLQDSLYAGLLCAVCFAGLFAMERRGGMEDILCATPLGRRDTVSAKLILSALLSSVIALSSCLPHLWQVLRDYGLPAPGAPAMSLSEFVTLPGAVTLGDLLIFWVLCRTAACLLMATVTLWLGQVFGSFLPALFVSAVVYCLPPLLALSGMTGGIEWLGTYPLFHAVALLGIQGYSALDGSPYSLGWVVILLLLLAVTAAWGIAQNLIGRYEWRGIRLDTPL